MEKKIIEIIAKVLKVDVDDVDKETIIGELPGWDSLHHLQIITEIETEFNVKFNPQDLLELEDVSDLISLAEEL